LMRAKCGDIEVASRWSNPAKPTMDPWVIAEPYIGSATRVTLNRNPFFWQVDGAGNQLPYVDKLQFSVISEIETIILAAINASSKCTTTPRRVSARSCRAWIRSRDSAFAR